MRNQKQIKEKVSQTNELGQKSCGSWKFSNSKNAYALAAVDASSVAVVVVENLAVQGFDSSSLIAQEQRHSHTCSTSPDLMPNTRLVVHRYEHMAEDSLSAVAVDYPFAGFSANLPALPAENVTKLTRINSSNTLNIFALPKFKTKEKH